MNQSAQRKLNKKPQEKRVNHQARFVKESFGDRYPVFAGQTFQKTWTFRNGGESDWPEDTVFIQTNGDDLRAQPYNVPGPIHPNQEVEITLTLQAPIAPGNYNAFFRFLTGENNRFGQKVWCDILVQPEPMRPQVVNPLHFVAINEDRSSLLDDESIIVERPVAKEPSLNFEEVREEPSSVNPSPVVVEEVRPAPELAQSQIEE